MTSSEYNDFFEGLKNLKSLVNLSVIETSDDSRSLGFEVVFKALEALKELKTLKLILGCYPFAVNEMRAIWKHLLKHPSIEEVEISTPMARCTGDCSCFCFDDEFHGTMKKLKERLRRLIVIPLFAHKTFHERVPEIIMPDGIPNQNFAYLHGNLWRDFFSK